MGYFSRIELIDVEIKRGKGAALKRYIKEHRDDDGEFPYFLKFVKVQSGFLAWDPREECGKWRDDVEFATWLADHSAKRGRVLLHSVEGDGQVWGWEFDGRGMMQPLSFEPVGFWEHPSDSRRRARLPAGLERSGYYARIELVDVAIKNGRGAALKRYIKECKSRDDDFPSFFKFMTVTSGFLEWDTRAESGKWAELISGLVRLIRTDERSGDGEFASPSTDPWQGYSDTAAAPGDDEEFVSRLADYAGGGQIIFHSEEFDGNVWGWEFDGLGKMRPLGLKPDGLGRSRWTTDGISRSK